MYRPALRQLSVSRRAPAVLRQTRFYATPTTANATTSNPPPSTTESSEKKNYGQKVDGLIEEISKLTLVEAGWLVEGLKTKLNITAIAPIASGPVAAAPTAAPVEEEETAVQEKPKEKVIFSVKMTAIKSDAKAKVIKAVKSIRADMNLMQAKTFVESLPQVLKDNVTKEDADKLKTTLEEAGATVTLE